MSTVKIAFLGCGGFMKNHTQRLQQIADVQLAALCDITTDQVEKFIENNLQDMPQKPAVFTDAAEMYAQIKPDAVFIATPHTLHCQHAVQALKAGCHVHLEKPMVTNLDDAYSLAEITKQTGKTLVIGYNSPCSPEFAYLQSVIQSGELGKLEMVNGYLTQNWMNLTTGLWRQNPKLSGGGQAYDSGAHLLNSLCWSVASDVDSVFAWVDNHGTPVDINSVFVIKFANGVMASIAISGNSDSVSGPLTFIFEKGRIDIDAWLSRWIKVFKHDKEIKYPPITDDMGHESPTHNFIDAIRGKAQPRTSPQNGIIQSQLMDAIYESAKTGMPAKVNRRQ
ncbi:MAG: Gfo/Idh/MocA family oxidoreductase [Phycisphaeraceae bacterium]|nr:Gfo/Idh/MocA family oxidoreductase [Phycisphaeraceae bacterium]